MSRRPAHAGYATEIRNAYDGRDRERLERAIGKVEQVAVETVARAWDEGFSAGALWRDQTNRYWDTDPYHLQGGPVAPPNPYGLPIGKALRQESRLPDPGRRLETSMDTVNLGDEAVDLVTGFKGIATARTEWLNGCVRVSLQPKVDKEGKVPEAMTFDEPQLEVTCAGAVRVGSRDTGGPIPTPRQHAGPVR